MPFSPSGPAWYRGNSLENERAERFVMDPVLAALDARAMVVGHTPTATGRISSRFNGRLVRADVGMAYGEAPLALVLTGDEMAVFDPANGSMASPVVEPPSGEGWAKGTKNLPDERVELMLREGDVASRKDVGAARAKTQLWEIETDGIEFRAVYSNVHEKVRSKEGSPPARNSNHEVAAYLLDRKLGLDMVPVAVVRGSGRKAGTLRIVLESAIDGVAIKSYRNLNDSGEEEIVRVVAVEFGVAEEDLWEQVHAAWLFDALIAHLARPDDGVLFVPEAGRLALVDHEAAFGLDTRIDASIGEHCRGIEEQVEYALKLLDRAELLAEFKRYLSVEQIDALLARRDRLLELCTG